MRRLTQLGVGCLFLALAVFFALPTGMFGQQEGSQDQSPLTLKEVKERLKENQKYLKEAEKRGKAGDASGIQTAITNYNRNIDGLNTALDQGRIEGSPSQREDVYSRVGSSTSKGTSVLEGLLNKVPEQARSGIEHAIEVSQKGHNTALANLQRARSERAMAEQHRQNAGRPEGEGMGRPEGVGRPGGGFGGGMGGPEGHPGGGGPPMGSPGGGHPGPHR